jgi:hypothetical protein
MAYLCSPLSAKTSPCTYPSQSALSSRASRTTPEARPSFAMPSANAVATGLSSRAQTTVTGRSREMWPRCAANAIGAEDVGQQMAVMLHVGDQHGTPGDPHGGLRKGRGRVFAQLVRPCCVSDAIRPSERSTGWMMRPGM